MNIITVLTRGCALVLVLGLHPILSAQTDAIQKTMAEALRLREEVSAAVLKGELKPAQAMGTLAASATASGLKADREADFALAAIDLGQRLLAGGRPELAEEFFLEAEKSLEKALQKINDSAVQEKALFLQQLAFIRANFLNKAEAAQDDIDAAIKLQPDDKHLKALRENQARDKAEHLKNKYKN